MQKKTFTATLLLLSIGLMSFSLFLQVQPAKGATALTMWYYEEDLTDDTLLALVADYESANDVTVTMQFKAKEDMRYDFKIAHLLGTAPDILQGDAEWIPELALGDLLMPIPESEMNQTYMDLALRAVSFFVVNGGNYDMKTLAYYGLPQSVDVMAFLYNMDEVRTATIPDADGSWTTPEFQDAITRMNDQSLPSDLQFGFSFLNFLGAEEGLYRGTGGEMFFNNSIDSANNIIDSNSSVDALTFMHEIVNYYELTPSYKTGYYVNVDSSLDYTKIYEDFALNGNVSSTMLYASDLKKLLANGIFNNTAKLGIAPVPMDAEGLAPTLETTAFMISSSSGQSEAALDLIQYLTSPAAMVENAKNEYILPAIMSAFDYPALVTNEILQSYKPLLQTAAGKYISRFWITVEDIFEQQVTTMLRGGQDGITCATALQVNIDYEILPNAEHDPLPQDLSGFEYYEPVVETTTTTTDPPTNSTTEPTDDGNGIPFASPSQLMLVGTVTILLVYFSIRKRRI